MGGATGECGGTMSPTFGTSGVIFETSFREKKLPVEWKYANITPIYKKKVQGQMLVITNQSVLHVLCAK